MYAFMPRPTARFCEQVAQKLVKQYNWMKDYGDKSSGYVSHVIHLYMSVCCMHSLIPRPPLSVQKCGKNRMSDIRIERMVERV